MQNWLSFWTGPLPPQELHPDRTYHPLVHWVFHPLKRHLSRLYLKILQKYFGLKVIGITGSVGKTTTKDMLASILKWYSPTVASYSNITPTYNIPATIIKCNLSTRFLILEMGIEYPGDMDFYTWLATPEIAIITSVNRTHTAYLGSISDVAAEKSKILKNTSNAVINSDDPHITIKTDGKIFKFGSHHTDYCQIISSQLLPDFKTQIELKIKNLSAGSPDQKININLPLTGTHFASNSAAAAATASLLDVPFQTIIHGLETMTPPFHRLQVIPLRNGSTIIDDSYNANPLAVKAALDTLISLSQILNLTPVFVFGQMNELGQYEKEAHEEIGEYIKKLGIKHLYTTGLATKYTTSSAGFGKYFESTDELINPLNQMLNDKSKILILLKASRSYHFEDLVSSLISSHS